MNPDIKEFLNMAAWPGRVAMVQAAWLLGFNEHEIPILMAKGLLKPLGHPAHNGQKFFLTATLEDLRRDEKWFGKASDAVLEYWRYKNSRRGLAKSKTRERTDCPLASAFQAANESPSSSDGGSHSRSMMGGGGRSGG